MAECMGSKNNPQKHTNILLYYIKGQMETESTRLDGGGEQGKDESASWKNTAWETGQSE